MDDDDQEEAQHKSFPGSADVCSFISAGGGVCSDDYTAING
jgi:hypothetical protein